MTSQLHPDLIRLGNELEYAITRQIAVTRQITVASKSRRRLPRVGLIAAITAAVVAAGAGTAVAVAYLTEETVARGMPGGAAIFEGTDPACTTTDHVVYDCTLARAPHSGILPANGNFTNLKELFVDDQSNIAGGCNGMDAAGLHWVCYVGERAVSEGIIAEDMLGQHADGPTVG